MTPVPEEEQLLGIREVSERTGLSLDTLRWYEKQKLLPQPPRGSDGRRLYPERMVAFVDLVVALRRTGMAVADVRTFVAMTAQGAESQQRRLALLERQRERIHEQQRQLSGDLAAVEWKIAHYRQLTASGLDCDGFRSDDLSEGQRQVGRRSSG